MYDDPAGLSHCVGPSFRASQKGDARKARSRASSGCLQSCLAVRSRFFLLQFPCG